MPQFGRNTIPVLRLRVLYFPFILLAFVAGLTTHVLKRHLPGFVGENLPDTMWALWVFLMIAFIWPRVGTVRAAGYALLFAYLTEFSQIYHAPGLDRFRATTIGHLILGDTFQWSDLGCYTVGILTGAALDVWLRHRYRQR